MKNKNYTKKIISDYCVIDVETTGLSIYFDEIIEIALIKVRNDKIVEEYSQLIKPINRIDTFITELTGISNEMVENMPVIEEVSGEVLSFIGNDIILGHNTSFDLNFLKAGCKKEIDNKYMDTLQFARKLYPELKHHRLKDLSDYLKISKNKHRAMADCITTKELYDQIKLKMNIENIEIDNLWSKKITNKDFKPSNDNIDQDGFFYGKHVVFTGTLERMPRSSAKQMVVDLGAILDNSVVKATNILILGSTEYNTILRGEKSSKHIKAEKLKLGGQDIDIIDEYTFYDLLDEAR